MTDKIPTRQIMAQSETASLALSAKADHDKKQQLDEHARQMLEHLTESELEEIALIRILAA